MHAFTIVTMMNGNSLMPHVTVQNSMDHQYARHLFQQTKNELLHNYPEAEVIETTTDGPIGDEQEALIKYPNNANRTGTIIAKIKLYGRSV